MGTLDHLWAPWDRSDALHKPFQRTPGSFMRTRERFQRTEESSERTLDGVQSPSGASRHEEFADQSPLPGMPCTVSALPSARSRWLVKQQSTPLSAILDPRFCSGPQTSVLRLLANAAACQENLLPSTARKTSCADLPRSSDLRLLASVLRLLVLPRRHCRHPPIEPVPRSWHDSAARCGVADPTRFAD
jgi:hypothetical protein